MSKHPIKFLVFGAFSLSLFAGSLPANAQYSSDVVVPTTNGGVGGSTDSSVYSGDRYPSGGSVNYPSSGSVNTSARFSCQQYNGQYTVMYQPQSQPGQYFAWATPRTLGGGWDTARRCQTIADSTLR